MVESLTDKIASFLILNKEMNANKFVVYKSKIKTLIYLIISLIAVVLVGLIFNKVIQGIILLSCYLLIRKFAYGYKANNYITRIILFLGIFILTIFLSDYDDLTTYKALVITFTMLSFGGIHVLSPVNDIKNPIGSKKVIRCKIISRIIAFIIVVITIGTLEVYHLNEYAAFTSSALFWSAIMLVLGTIKNYIRS